jgi:acetylornithine/N-succinyldiaminopimelate aminotransferase
VSERIGVDGAAGGASLSELQELERTYAVPTYIRNPVQFVRGEGCRLWDSDGNEYLDFLAGISVLNVGHCHPQVVQAVRDQVGMLTHVTNLYYTEPALRLSAALSQSSLAGKVFLCNSGAEANEAAIKLVRRARPHGKIIVLEGAFHGRTYGALSATPQESKQAPFAPLVPGFVVVPKDPVALAAAVDADTAAVLIEPIQGETGINVIPDELLLAARTACNRAGAALVFDEIQTGMGRTGTLWGYEQTPVVPDAMTSAKALGGGLPIGALITGPQLADTLAPGDHGSTFAGRAGGVLDLLRRAAAGARARARRAAASRVGDAARDRRGARARADGRNRCSGRRLGARDCAARAARATARGQRHRPGDDPARAAADRRRGRG